MEIKNKNLAWYITNTVWTVLSYTLPSKLYLSLKYKLIYGRWIDWNNPTYFTEKLQWLKLYGYGKSQARYVDKVLVKDYVKETVGAEHVIPTINVWDSAKKIDFASLPEEFVLKCNHDSGSLVICKDKSTLDKETSVKNLEKVLHTDYYLMGRETPYKYVEKRVLAEKLVKNETGLELRDFKFFCFNGDPKIFKIDFGRFVDHHANYYDVQKNLLPFGEIWPPRNPEVNIEIPENFEEMVIIARKLAQGFPFVRVDLYNNDGVILFGEMTFFPTSGFGGFTDEEWDKKLGSWISLPEKNTL